jgi:predicted O-methyltransferase YrrM
MRTTLHFLLWRLGLRPAESQTSPAERACLERHARGRRRLAEIGVFQGVTTARLRAAMAPDGVLVAVDPFPRGRLGVSLHRRIARRVVAAVPRGTVLWLETSGAEAVRDPRVLAAPFDFLFIDGDHSWQGIAGDWQGWTPLLAPGAVVGLHDSRATDGAESERFTREVVLRDPRFRVVEELETLTVLEAGARTG